jgi:hypothetical protein
MDEKTKRPEQHQSKMKNIIFHSPQSKIHTITEVTTTPPSFDWTLKIEFLPHFYFKKYKIKLRSGKELHPSMVIYISSSKRLNYYYAPRA